MSDCKELIKCYNDVRATIEQADLTSDIEFVIITVSSICHHYFSNMQDQSMGSKPTIPIYEEFTPANKD